jgi:ectoine hydroxylase-related dioxygenase (phytanoyl-CoA dioxygenase family)
MCVDVVRGRAGEGRERPALVPADAVVDFRCAFAHKVRERTRRTVPRGGSGVGSLGMSREDAGASRPRDDAALAARFLRDGYVVVEDVLSPAELEAVRATTTRHVCIIFGASTTACGFFALPSTRRVRRAPRAPDELTTRRPHPPPETPAQVRAECDAVTRRYAELGGHGDPIQTRDTPPDARDHDDRHHDSDDRATAPSKRRRTTSPAADDLQWLSREFGCILEVPGCCACCPPPDPRTGNYRAEGCRVGSPAVRRLLAPDGALGALAAALLAPLRHKTHLFNDQYIVKPPSSAHARFSWHRDSQWCDEPDAAQHHDDDDDDDDAETTKSENRAAGSTRDAPSYLSLWTALDDAHAANGAVRVLPYPRDGDGDGHGDGESDPDPVPGRGHAERSSAYPLDAARLDALAIDRWRDDDAAAEASVAFADVVIADVRAGSVLAMSDKVLHCSGPNASSVTRRAWMPQFSDGAVTRRPASDDKDGRGAPVALAVPIDALS